MQAPKIKPFVGTVIEEKEFRVEFSNQGRKPHDNPCPTNARREVVQCRFKGCPKQTRALLGFCPEHNKGKHRKQFKHDADWIGVLVPPKREALGPVRGAKATLKTYIPSHAETTELLVQWMQKSPNRRQLMDTFFQKTLETIAGNVPDATTLQGNFERDRDTQPHNIIGLIMAPVDTCFPTDPYGHEGIGGVRLKPPKPEPGFVVDIPLRVVAALLVTGFACEECNRGDYWCYKKQGVDPNKSKRASVYMSAVYYLLRRHTNASPKQAHISQRT